MRKSVLTLLCLVMPLGLVAGDGAPVRILSDGKWGFMSSTGQVLVQPQYDMAYRYRNGYTVVVEDGKRAYLDSTGKPITDFSYDSAYHFFNDFATVVQGKLYGLVDKSGKLVAGPDLNYCADCGSYTVIRREAEPMRRVLNARGEAIAVADTDFSCVYCPGSDTLIVKQGGKVGVIDQTGSVVVPFAYGTMSSARDGVYLAGAQPWGSRSLVLDKAGSTLLQYTKLGLVDYYRGFAVTGTWGKFGLVDAQGNDLLSPEYQSLTLDEAGVALGWTGAWDARVFIILNLKSREKTTLQLGYLWRFDERGQSPLVQGSKYGVIDKDGRLIVTPQYDYIDSYSEDLAPVQVGKKWGYLDRSGTMVIQPQFDAAYGFSEGLAVVRIGERAGGKRGYIDKSGHFVIQPVFDWAYSFEGGVAHVALGDFQRGTFGYINRAGEYLWKPSH